MNSGIVTVAWAPLVPVWLLAALGIAAAALLLFSAFRRARGVAFRTLALATALAALANPSVVEEERDPLTDVVLILADTSASQNIGERRGRTAAAVEELAAALAAFPDLEVRIVNAGGEGGADGTRLFAALERALADVPPERVAGAIFVTDGQVHDAPEVPADWRGIGAAPLHVLLSGERNEGDRKLEIVRAPSYGVVGGDLVMTVRIDDPAAGNVPTGLSVTIDGGEPRRITAVPGRNVDIPIALEHGGPTVVEIEADPGSRELTLRNNRAAAVINGVRDRLRVMLISGEPHAGERTWRNLLKADPSVDLVHFTILRPPEKQDVTPIRELSLIAFPVRQLFDERLEDFDLIIFDRYRQRGVIPRAYMQNIADFVTAGGAILEAAGPEFASAVSLYTTPIAAVLPGEPSGISEGPFRPKVSTLGERHPVSAGLPGAGPEPEWGSWFRIVDAVRLRGDILMEGEAGRPLLILDRVGEGRVAQLLSDQAWLWARGYEGGGPQAELLRRMAHWLMKEPDLEEERLFAVSSGNRLEITRQTLEADPPREATVTGPDGAAQTVALEPAGGGRWTAAVAVDEGGLYRVRHGDLEAIAAVGKLNPLEEQDLRTTDEVLAALVRATGGGTFWLADGGAPDIRRVRPGRDAAGRTWMGLPDNESFVVTGVRETPLIPAVLALLLLLGGLLGAWVREGR